MNQAIWLFHSRVSSSIVLVILLYLSFSCSRSGPREDLKETTFKKLLIANEIFVPKNCRQTVSEVSADWNHGSMSVKEYFDKIHRPYPDTGCIWSRIKLANSDSTNQIRVLYLPTKWTHLDFYALQPNSTFEKATTGFKYNKEVYFATVPANDTVTLFVKRLREGTNHIFRLGVVEMSEEAYHSASQRGRYKYLFLGLLLFPILYFGFQLIFVEREKIIFYYFVFLIGAGLNLITILDTIAVFEFTPRITLSFFILAKSFVLSIFLTLFGLIKFIQTLLEIPNYAPSQVRIGNLLLSILGITALAPFVYPHLFDVVEYDRYLKVYRLTILPPVLYLGWVCVWATIKKVRFSSILSLAFAPFIFSVTWYNMSFIVLSGYAQNNSASLILIIGFMVSLFLFGIILGVKNNSIKKENIVLEERTARFKELNAFKSRFYTNFTHEFRTPLTVINGVAGQIKGHEKQTSLIRRNGERLLMLINQLLDLTKLENNSLEINWIWSDIINYLQYITESHIALAYEKQITLAFFSPEAQLEMDYDPEKIQHVLVNLLSNAIKFTPEYGSVKVIATKVEQNDTPFLQISVKDSGMGISEEEIPRIFERFYQIDNSSSPSFGGSGIGLSLVKELVALMGGGIVVESTLGKGSEFKVRLPIHHHAEKRELLKDMKPIYSIDASSTSSASIGTDEQTLVLLIEDNVDVTTYIISCLANGFRVETARNGKQGVEKALEIVPDIVICDVMMPEMNGFEVCKQLKTDRRTSHIPIILLTARATKEDKVMGLAKGADAYLTKPFDEEELLVRINNLTALRKRIQDYLNSNTIDQEKLPDSSHKEEFQFLNDLKQFIEQYLSNESFNTNHLCQLMAMSRTQLHRKIKALTGEPTASFIKNYRLKKAKSLIETTEMSIGEIASAVGFKDVPHFSRSFSQVFGQSPSKLRKG